VKRIRWAVEKQRKKGQWGKTKSAWLYGDSRWKWVKGIVIYFHVIPYQFVFLSSVEHKWRYFEECTGWSMFIFFSYCYLIISWKSWYIIIWWIERHHRHKHNHHMSTKIQKIQVMILLKCTLSLPHLFSPLYPLYSQS